MAGDEVVMPANTLMMVHNMNMRVDGNPSQLRKAADDLDVINSTGREAYLQKAGDKLSRERLVEMMDAETWLPARECVELGLADRLADETESGGEGERDSPQQRGGAVMLAARAMGFDISALVEYPLFDTLDVGGYANIPIVPARLKGKVSATATLSAQCDSIMRVITDDSKFEKTAEITDAVYSDANYAVNRPMRLGAECAWRPVGKWLTLRGSAGLALRNPFGEDFSVKSVYPEYKLGVEIVGIGMFGLNLSTEYTKKIFAHSVGIMLNFRAIEFDIAAAVCSPTFIQSFKGGGLCASAAVKLGW
jgi:hypothetical protein